MILLERYTQNNSKVHFSDFSGGQKQTTEILTLVSVLQFNNNQIGDKQNRGWISYQYQYSLYKQLRYLGPFNFYVDYIHTAS